MTEYIQRLSEVIIEIEQKLLVPIINNKLLHSMSPRIQRLKMRLMTFQVHTAHIKRKELADAGTLSMAVNEQPVTTDKKAEKEVMIHMNMITNNMQGSTDGFEEITIHNLQDKTLQILIE